MGFGVAAGFAILFATFAALAGGLLIAVDKYTATTREDAQVDSNRIADVAHTAINIRGVSNSSGRTIYVENTGGTVLKPDYVVLIIDGILLPQSYYSHSMSSVYWKPAEILEIYTSYAPANPNNFTVRVAVENGITANYTYLG